MTTWVTEENLQIEVMITAATRENVSNISSEIAALFDGVSFLKSQETSRGVK